MAEITTITCRPAKDGEYDPFLKSMFEHAGDYLEPSLMVLGIDSDDFGDLFKKVGQVFAIEKDGEVAGFYWVENRERVLHLHAIIIYPEFRKQGLARETLAHIESMYSDEADELELGVHETNTRARKVFEQAGFEVVRTVPELDFFIMRRSIT